MRLPLGVLRTRIADLDIVAVEIVGTVQVARDAHQAREQGVGEFEVDLTRRNEPVVFLELGNRCRRLRAKLAVNRSGVVAEQGQHDLERTDVEAAVFVVDPGDADAIGQKV